MFKPWPSTIGNEHSARSFTAISVWHMPVATTFTNTSSAAGGLNVNCLTMNGSCAAGATLHWMGRREEEELDLEEKDAG